MQTFFHEKLDPTFSDLKRTDQNLHKNTRKERINILDLLIVAWIFKFFIFLLVLQRMVKKKKSIKPAGHPWTWSEDTLYIIYPRVSSITYEILMLFLSFTGRCSYIWFTFYFDLKKMDPQQYTNNSKNVLISCGFFSM